MSMSPVWPRNPRLYEDLLRDVEILLETGRRLPDLPFRGLGHLDFCQFSDAIEGPFELVLRALVDVHGDEYVSVATFDPEPSAFHAEYGSHGAFKIPASTISDTYWTAVSDRTNGELIFSANVVALVGSAARWAVWAERSWDMAIVLSEYEDGPWRSQGVDFVPVETALANFTEPDFKTPLSGRDRTTFLKGVRKALRGSTPAFEGSGRSAPTFQAGEDGD